MSDGATGAVPTSLHVATVRQVLAWVGHDHERAHTALDVERARDVPRVTVVDTLERMLAR